MSQDYEVLRRLLWSLQRGMVISKIDEGYIRAAGDLIVQQSERVAKLEATLRAVRVHVPEFSGNSRAKATARIIDEALSGHSGTMTDGEPPQIYETPCAQCGRRQPIEFCTCERAQAWRAAQRLPPEVSS